MKTYFLIIIVFFASIFAEADIIDSQFAIDVLTGKTAVAAKPCSGPPGSGCENIVPQMSVERRTDIQTRQPEPKMTPANPIEYARQQVPRYPQYPAWGYQTRIPIQQIQPVQVWQPQRNLYQEVAIIYGTETTAEYNRRKLAEIAARQVAEKTRNMKTDTPPQEITPVPSAVSQEPQIQRFSVSASAHTISSPISLATRSLVIPSWFYEVLWRIIVGILVSFIIGWELKILLRT